MNLFFESCESSKEEEGSGTDREPMKFLELSGSGDRDLVKQGVIYAEEVSEGILLWVNTNDIMMTSSIKEK